MTLHSVCTSIQIRFSRALFFFFNLPFCDASFDKDFHSAGIRNSMNIFGSPHSSPGQSVTSKGIYSVFRVNNLLAN